MSPVKLTQNAMLRWIVESAAVQNHAWSGARWVPIDRYGFPSGSAQVSNFTTREEAAEYCQKFGFTVLAAEAEQQSESEEA